MSSVLRRRPALGRGSTCRARPRRAQTPTGGVLGDPDRRLDLAATRASTSRHALAAAAVLTALAVGLMGCSGSDSGGDLNTGAEGTAGDAGAPVPPAADPGGDNAGEKDAGGGSVAGAGAGADLRIDTRSIIYNG